MNGQKIIKQFFDLRLEKAVLGRIIFYKQGFMRASEILESKHFSDKDCALIFQVYEKLFIESPNSPDELDLIAKIKQLRGLDFSALVMECSQLAETAWNIEEKANAIKELWVRRQLEEVGLHLSVSPNSASVLLDDTFNKILTIKGDKIKGETLNADAIAEQSAERILGRVAARQAGESLPGAISTGFKELDNSLVGGMLVGEYLVLAARPGMGKTSIAGSIALRASLSRPVLFMSFDMHTDILADKLMSAEASVEYEKIRLGELNEAEIKRVQMASIKIANSNLQINGKSKELTDFAATCKLWAMKHTRETEGLIIVDYLQQMRVKGMNQKIQYVSEASNYLKDLGKETNSAIIALAQLSRAVEQRGGDKKPILSDLRDSGEIEQDATAVWFAWRAEYYGFETDEYGNSSKGILTIIPAKNRNGFVGDGSEVNMKFQGQYARITDYSGLFGNVKVDPQKISLYDDDDAPF